MKSIRLLLDSVIDYAGLFPPASLGMAESVRNYADYRDGQHSWALGRFIVPISRLDEFEACVVELRLSRPSGPHWRLSVLGGTEPKDDLEHIVGFNRRQRRNTGAPVLLIDTIEWKAGSAQEIERCLSLHPDGFATYFELPLSDNTGELIGALARTGGRAKVRTGGLRPELFPSPGQLARFILLCVNARVPFKATAGLHHALRSIHPLTYEPASPSGIMHGFLNLLLASAITLAGADVETMEAVLQEETKEAFQFDEDGACWRDRRFANRQLLDMREQLFIAFGACSFQEPTSELQALNLL